MDLEQHLIELAKDGDTFPGKNSILRFRPLSDKVDLSPFY